MGSSLSVLPTVAVLIVVLFDFVYLISMCGASKCDTSIGNCSLGAFGRKCSLLVE